MSALRIKNTSESDPGYFMTSLLQLGNCEDHFHFSLPGKQLYINYVQCVHLLKLSPQIFNGTFQLDSESVLLFKILRNNSKHYVRSQSLNPFTPRSDQLQSSLSVSHRRYISVCVCVCECVCVCVCVCSARVI